MIDKNDVGSSFSEELYWIKDKKLRDKVVEVWVKAANQGKWKCLDDAPFTLLFENSGKLTDHTKRVTRMVKGILDLRTEDINEDILIAGALLHDVGKLLEYEFRDGKYVKSDYAMKFRHPVSGAMLVKECGLPDDVVHIVYAHSKEGDITLRSPEAIIVNHCDFIDFEIRKTLV